MISMDTDEKKELEKKKLLRNLISLLIKLTALVLIVYVIFSVFFGIKRMDTSFMSPYITEGDLLIYYRIDQNYELGDVILIENNNKTDVYRIVAKPGQTVDINNSGELLIDGYPEEHVSFYKTQKDENSEIKFPYQVEQGKYFVMNDYRLQKNDSRTFGTIPEDSINGKIICRLQIRNI